MNNRFKYSRTISQRDKFRNPDELHFTQWHMLGLMGIGFLLPYIGTIGKVLGYIILILVGFLFFDILIKNKQSSARFFFLLGFIIGGEAFFRDYVMRGFVGYMVVEYLLIGLGVLSLDPILKKSSRIPKSMIPWLIFSLWSGFSLLYSQSIDKGRWFFVIYLSGLFTILMCSAFSKQGSKRDFLYGIAGGVSLAFGTTLYNEILNPQNIERFGHSFLSAVQVGIFLTVGLLALVLLIIQHKKKFISFIFPIIAFSIGAVLTFSRGPVFGFILVLPFFFLGSSKFTSKIKFLLFFVLLIGSLYLFVSTNYQESFIERYTEVELDTGRVNIWARSMDLWRKKPVFGWGVGSWAIIYPHTSYVAVSDAHNFLFQILVETGLIGAVFVIIFLLSTLVSIIKRKNFIDLGILAYIVSVGLVENWKIAIYFGLFAIIFMRDNMSMSPSENQETYAASRF
jgi:O-antigen ligase